MYVRDKGKIYHSLNNARVWYNDTLIYRGTSMSTDKMKWKRLSLWFIDSLLAIVNDEHLPLNSRLNLLLSVCSTIKTIGGKTPPPWEFRFCLLKLQNTGSWREKSIWGRWGDLRSSFGTLTLTLTFENCSCTWLMLEVPSKGIIVVVVSERSPWR